MVLQAQPGGNGATDVAGLESAAPLSLTAPVPYPPSGPLRNPFPPIADYAFLSDCENTCLISSAGAVEWLCVPRPDSPSVFGAILDRGAGHFRLGPYGVSVPAARRYLLTLESLGVPVEVHHHEVATAGQMEIGTRFSTLTERADWTQDMKYVIQNVAHNFGKTATFMPKPIMGDNGSGMHVHQSIWKDGQNLFAGDGYAGLSEMALYYIGGIIKHAKALNAITNPSTNSYKRLVPHFEAPTKLAYSAKNRSASIRIPHVASSKARRIEARFPDPMANPYLCFAALLMAGLDGIQNKIHPGDPADKNLYDLPPEEDALVPTVCASLEEALEALKADHDFLTRGGVFSQDWINSYIAFKEEDVRRIRMAPHPLEFEMYYSL